jgi:hypothetical protein
LIPPIFSDDTPKSIRRLPKNLLEATQDNRFDVGVDTARRNLTALTGQNFPHMYKPAPFQAMRENEYAEAIRRAMFERGSQNFLDLVRILENIQPEIATSGRSEQIVKAFWHYLLPK